MSDPSQPFDPAAHSVPSTEPLSPHPHEAQHQAISVVSAEQAPNTVVSVLQKGYSIAERILRPALVTVTAAS